MVLGGIGRCWKKEGCDGALDVQDDNDQPKPQPCSSCTHTSNRPIEATLLLAASSSRIFKVDCPASNPFAIQFAEMEPNRNYIHVSLSSHFTAVLLRVIFSRLLRFHFPDSNRADLGFCLHLERLGCASEAEQQRSCDLMSRTQQEANFIATTINFAP